MAAILIFRIFAKNGKTQISFYLLNRALWFPDILRNAIKSSFLKFGMEVHWVNSLYGIAFGGN